MTVAVGRAGFIRTLLRLPGVRAPRMARAIV
jgi:hypothetical protein